VLHRLFFPGSDRAAEKWKLDYRIERGEAIELQQLYRAMYWLGEGRGKKASNSFMACYRKDSIEEALFARRCELFSELELVFFDTTSLYFEGSSGKDIGRRGHSKDSRPDLAQMIVGAILDSHGMPLCSEFWPGNTADVKTLLPVTQRLKERFGISSMCIVADRGDIVNSCG
jgi:transposase